MFQRAVANLIKMIKRSSSESFLMEYNLSYIIIWDFLPFINPVISTDVYSGGGQVLFFMSFVVYRGASHVHTPTHI